MASRISYSIDSKTLLIHRPAPYLGEGEHLENDISGVIHPMGLKGESIKYSVYVRIVDGFRCIGTYATVDAALTAVDKVQEALNPLLELVARETER